MTAPLRGSQDPPKEALPAHTLRRTALTALLESDLDLAAVSQVAGHANTQTTAMYDERLLAPGSP